MTHRQRNLTLFGLALIFLLFAIGLEHPYFDRSTTGSVVFNLKSLVSIFKEVSFALLIALVISVGIEQHSRKSDHESAEKMRREIAFDVFQGVFSRSLPKNYVDLVIGLHLKPSVIRRDMATHITLETLSENFQKHLDSESYILFRSYTTFKIENISPVKMIETLHQYCPTCRIEEIKGEVGLTKYNIRRAHSDWISVYDKIIFRDEEDSLEYDFDLSLDQNETVEIETEVIIIKEVSDNQVWSSMNATLQFEIDISVSVPGIMIGILPRTAVPFEQVFKSADNHAMRWRANAPLLRGETVTIFWY